MAAYRNALEELNAVVEDWEEGFVESMRCVGRKQTTITPIMSRVRAVLTAMAGITDAVGLDAFLQAQTGTRKTDLTSAWKKFAEWLELGRGVELPRPMKQRLVNTLTEIGPHLYTIATETPVGARDLHLIYWGSVKFPAEYPGCVALPYVDRQRQTVEYTDPLGDPVHAAVLAIRRWAHGDHIPKALDPFVPREPGTTREAGYAAIQQTLLEERRKAEEQARREGRLAEHEDPMDDPFRDFATGKAEYQPPEVADEAARRRHAERLRGDFVAERSRTPDPAVTHTLPDGEPIAAMPGEVYDVYWERRLAWLRVNRPGHPDLTLREDSARAARQNLNGSPSGGGGPMSSSSSGEVKPNVSGVVGETSGASGFVGASGGENTGTSLPSTGTIATGAPAEKGEAGAMPPVLLWDAPAASGTANASGTAPVPSGSDDGFDPPVAPPAGN